MNIIIVYAIHNMDILRKHKHRFFFMYYCYLRKTYDIIIIMAHVRHGQNMKNKNLFVIANTKSD